MFDSDIDWEEVDYDWQQFEHLSDRCHEIIERVAVGDSDGAKQVLRVLRADQGRVLAAACRIDQILEDYRKIMN